ncbi:hypothetical protein V7968_31590 [Nocardia vulneris]|uniref:hypothetical protein n=1 Tax=Nocardia vulneris TaxID=1141657 RepID=UPI0030CB6EC7
MTNRIQKREFLNAELLKLLRVADFGRRYLHCYTTLASRYPRGDHSADPQVVRKILSESILPFRYFRKERFFGYIDRRHGYDVLLHVTIRRSTVEFALFVSSKVGVIGGQWSKLAHQAVKGDDAEVAVGHETRGLPFDSEDSLRQIIEGAVDLFGHAKDLICAHFDRLPEVVES